MKNIIVLLLAFASCHSFALDIPANSPYDERVKTVIYNPSDVVGIVAHYGFVTHLEFGSNEIIQDVAMGDREAWEVTPKKDYQNYLFLKPVADRAKTNLTVITKKDGKLRSYQFYLNALWPEYTKIEKTKNMFFTVQFQYPNDVNASAIANNYKDEIKSSLKQGGQNTKQNRNYSVCGSSSITPDEGYDDGSFTYLRFAANREIPGIFKVNNDNSESIVNPYVEGDWHIIQGVSRKLVLRKGSQVACITNESFDEYGVRPTTGTISPRVERVLKGAGE